MEKLKRPVCAGRALNGLRAKACSPSLPIAMRIAVAVQIAAWLTSNPELGEEGPIAGFELRDIWLSDAEGGEFKASYVEESGARLCDADQNARPAKGARLSDSGRAFLDALQEAAGAGGRRCKPLPDMPEVVAVDPERVREIFYPRWPADGDEAKKAEARRKQFNRGMKDATKAHLAATIEVDGVQLVWSLKNGL